MTQVLIQWAKVSFIMGLVPQRTHAYVQGTHHFAIIKLIQSFRVETDVRGLLLIRLE